MIKKVAILTILMCLYGILPVSGQSITASVINMAGFSGSSGEISITSNIGELLITTTGDEERILTQGFLQPVIAQPCANADIKFYPNPAQDEIYVSATDCDIPVTSVAVTDLYGRVIARQQIVDGKVSLLDFNPGVYLVQSYFEDEQLAGTFKIAKISN